MADVTSIMSIQPQLPELNGRILLVTTGDAETADDGDTFTVNLALYNATKILGIIGFIHTTLNSVVVQEQPTTSVSGSTLTVTVGGSTDNKKRVYMIWIG